jgi:hypothetical protein
VIEAKQNRPKKDKNGGNTQNPDAAYNIKKALKARLKRFMALKCT